MFEGRGGQFKWREINGLPAAVKGGAKFER